MTDLNNKLNLNNVGNAYTPNFKKGKEEAVKAPVVETEPAETKADGLSGKDSYGRALVKQSEKVENPETIQCVKDSVEAFLKNPQKAATEVKAMDDAHEFNVADGIEHPYEEACCGIGDAACKCSSK